MQKAANRRQTFVSSAETTQMMSTISNTIIPSSNLLVLLRLPKLNGNILHLRKRNKHYLIKAGTSAIMQKRQIREIKTKIFAEEKTTYMKICATSNII